MYLLLSGQLAHIMGFSALHVSKIMRDIEIIKSDIGIL